MGRTVTKIRLVELNADKPPDEIAEITGIRKEMVYYYLRKLNIPPVVLRTRDLLPTADELRAEGLTQKELAIKYSVGLNTIKRRLKDAGNNDGGTVQGATKGKKETNGAK